MARRRTVRKNVGKQLATTIGNGIVLTGGGFLGNIVIDQLENRVPQLSQFSAAAPGIVFGLAAIGRAFADPNPKKGMIVKNALDGAITISGVELLKAATDQVMAMTTTQVQQGKKNRDTTEDMR